MEMRLHRGGAETAERDAARQSRNQNLREPLRPLRFKASKKDQPRGTQGFAEKNLFEAGLLCRGARRAAAGFFGQRLKEVERCQKLS